MNDRLTLILAWEAVMACAVVGHAWLLWQDERRKAALRRERRNGPAKLVTWQDKRADMGGLVAFAILMAVGPSFHLELLSRFGVAGLFFAFAILLQQTALKIHDRDELFHSLEEALPNYVVKP